MAEKDIEKEEVKKNKPKKKWFRKILKWFFGLIVLLVVVVAGGIYYAYNHWNWQGTVRQLVHQYGSEAVGTSVNIGNIDLSLQDGKGSIGNIKVANPDGYSQKYVIDLEGVSVAVNKDSITKLIKELAHGDGPKTKTVVINEIHVNQPAVVYEFLTLNRTNVDDILANIKKNTASTKAEPQEPAKADGITYNVAIKKVVVANGKATVAANLLGAGQSLSLSLPTITISDLGTEKQGITIEEGLARIFQEILKTTANVVSNADLSSLMGGVGNLAGAAVDGATNAAGAAVDGAASAAGVAVDGASAAVGGVTDGVKGIADGVGGLFK